MAFKWVASDVIGNALNLVMVFLNTHMPRV